MRARSTARRRLHRPYSLHELEFTQAPEEITGRVDRHQAQEGPAAQTPLQHLRPVLGHTATPVEDEDAITESLGL